MTPRPEPASCEAEPIHIPGSIQPHGLLLVLSEPELNIVSASANVSQHLGASAQELIGAPLSRVLGSFDVEWIRNSLQRPGRHSQEAQPLRVADLKQQQEWMAVVHRHDGLALLELEPMPAAGAIAGSSALMAAGAAAKRLQAAVTPAEACQIAAEQVREMTGFDRVKIYRFASDWSGEVLGESREPDMPSYLGLHFPASDIPPQARALYVLNPVRLIADARYQPSPLRPAANPANGKPFDLSHAALRSVSPVHLEYLHNMQVQASMSVSVLRRGSLWGLIACHHRQPLHVGFEARQAAVLVAQMLAAQFEAQERVEQASRNGQMESLRARLLDAAANGNGLAENLRLNAAGLLSLPEAGGMAVILPERSLHFGVLPGDAFLAGLSQWLYERGTAQPFETDRLASLYPAAAAETATASGLLAVPLSHSRRSWLLWFRPEQAQTITWAGAPQKNASELPGEPLRLHPRASFAAWKEQVRGRAQPWQTIQSAMAMQLRELVLDLMVREKEAVEFQNLRLVRGARELETFIYVAAHDIREPLRQMEMLTSLLRNCVTAEAASEAEGYFGEFSTLSKRLRRLTDELETYARLGRAETEPEAVALGEVVQEVLQQLQSRIAEAGAEVQVGALPTVKGERAQLHQVFLNIIGNSLKYRAAARPCRIVIAARAANPLTEVLDAPGPAVCISVADNGIGFEDHHAERILEAFVRLHSKDRYEGSGLGLAICRRIIERLGGRIEAEGRPDAGSRFTILLPFIRQGL